MIQGHAHELTRPRDAHSRVHIECEQQPGLMEPHAKSGNAWQSACLPTTRNSPLEHHQSTRPRGVASAGGMRPLNVRGPWARMLPSADHARPCHPLPGSVPHRAAPHTHTPAYQALSLSSHFRAASIFARRIFMACAATGSEPSTQSANLAALPWTSSSCSCSASIRASAMSACPCMLSLACSC